MEMQKNVCYGEATATPVSLDPVYDEVACVEIIKEEDQYWVQCW